MRDRLEDLGRVLEKLEQVVRLGIWDSLPERAEAHIIKDLDAEELDRWLADLNEAYDILTEAREICQGEDYLNREMI